MKTTKFKSRKSIRDYQTLALTLLTIAFFGIFAVRPSLTLIVSLFHERDLYTKVDKQLEDKIQQIIALQSDYMRLLSKKDLIDSAIPESPQVEEIGQLFKKELVLNAFSVAEVLMQPKPTTGLLTIPISLGGKTEYDALSTYLHSIYVAPRLFYVKNIDINRADEASTSATLQFSSQINTYYYIDKQ